MKFVGLFKGEFKILENIDISQLESMKADFAWADVDSVDPKALLILKNVYGIEPTETAGFPTIIPYDGYSLVVTNYYEEETKKVLQIFVSKKYVVTLHQGSDSVCDETMASLNEMLVSGNVNPGEILRGLFSALLIRHKDYLLNVRGTLRSMDTQLRKGIKNVSYLTQMEDKIRELQRVFYDTRSQIGDIILKAPPVSGVDQPEILADVYAQANELAKSADDLLEAVETYTTQLVPNIWKQLNRVKGISFGLTIFGLSIGLALLFLVFFPAGILGLAPQQIVMLVIAIGTIGLIATQRKLKFRIS